VYGFTEVDPASGKVIPVSAATRRCKTLWEMLGEHGLKSHLVSWFATQGERDNSGCVVSNLFNSFRHRKDDAPEDWPAPPAGTYWPESLGEHLNGLRVSPWDIDGDEVIRLLVPDAPAIDQTRDRRLWTLAERLGEAFQRACRRLLVAGTPAGLEFHAVYYAHRRNLPRLHALHPPRMAGIPERDFDCTRT